MSSFIESVLSRRHSLHWLLPIVLVLLFLSILIWLPWQAKQMESNEREEQLIADTLWVEQTIRFQLGRDEESIRMLGTEIISGYLPENQLRGRVEALLRNNRELYRLVWLDNYGSLVASTGAAWGQTSEFSNPSRAAAAARAREVKTPHYNLPALLPAQQGPLLLNFHVPLYRDNHYIGSLIASFLPNSLLEEMVPWWFAQENEILLTDHDDKAIARRAAGGNGRGVYTHRRELDLPGLTLVLNTNSTKAAPNLLPNLLVGSVILLALGLLWSLWALWRDINRRLAAEGALRQQVSFRSAMENSLVTGLRARDLEGRVTYVNPAFCQMVGYRPDELVGKVPPMPYWAPEAMEDYQDRFAKIIANTMTSQGFETIYQRANGERFPILVYEAKLLDENGKQTGWMSSILDISDRKRVEDINRQQSEKLQASARLATMGEITSMLAHELNQPLAAISSYMTGAVNMLQSGSAIPERLKPVLEKANIQAQRAGQIIRSVHEFVKKRESTREQLSVQSLINGIIPLVELQAHQFYVTIHTGIRPDLPPVLADRVMIEQVLLNLTRNAIEAMQASAPEQRVLAIDAVLEMQGEDAPPLVVITVTDHGHGISDEVADRLYSPFFSTKAEGMGMGLNICRTTIEFHGGTLTHHANPAGGTVFRFTLPALT